MADLFPYTPAPPKQGIVSKVLDIWAAPQHAVVGALEAMSQGGDPFEGAQTGIESKRSFVDIFHESGMNPTAAGMLGFGADVLSDPLNLVPFGLVGHKLAEGASMVPGLARTALHTGLPRSVTEVLAETPRVSAEALNADTRAGAARDAFKLAMGTEDYASTTNDILKQRALADAKRAAVRSGTPAAADDVVVEGNFINNVTKRLGARMNESRFGKVLGDLQLLRRRWVTNLKTTLIKDPAFGPQGPAIAEGLVRSEQVADKLEGELSSYFDRYINPLLKNDEERKNFTELLGGEGVQAMNPRIEEAVKLAREADNGVFANASAVGLRELVPKTHAVGQEELFPEIAAKAREIAKGDPAEYAKVPIQYRQNHVPRFYTSDTIAALSKPGEIRTNAMKKLVENGLATNMDDASRVVDEMLHASDGYFTSAEFRGGPLQFSRELLLDLPWEKDPRKWWKRYSHISSRRIAQGAVFGPQDEKLTAWLENVAENGGDHKRAFDIYRNIIGRPTREMSRGHALAAASGAVQTVSWLGPKTAMLQFMQLANSVGEYGAGNTIRAMGGLLKDPVTRDLATEVGALLPSSNQSFEGDVGSSFSSWWLNNITQMPRADRVVRTVSGTAGMLAARQWGKALPTLTGRGAQVAARNLTRLGIDPAEVLANSGELSAPQLRTAFLNGANTTQFASHLSDMPEAWKTPLGRFIFKFRAFSKQQTTFVSNLVDEAFRHKNPKPLMRYLAAYPAIFQSVRPVLDFLAMRPPRDQEESAMDYLKGILYTGMLGGLGDFYNNATANDTSRTIGMLTGPAAGQAAQFVTDVGAATQGDFGPLKQSVLRTTPLRPLNLFAQ
jgi:hypothetical protein